MMEPPEPLGAFAAPVMSHRIIPLVPFLVGVHGFQLTSFTAFWAFDIVEAPSPNQALLINNDYSMEPFRKNIPT
jgi:hypothetical protein